MMRETESATEKTERGRRTMGGPAPNRRAFANLFEDPAIRKRLVPKWASGKPGPRTQAEKGTLKVPLPYTGER